MLGLHRALGTWTRKVDAYIALTDFARQRFLAAGLPDDRVVVKPNFIFPDPGAGTHRGRYGLFVGRLSPEKGVSALLRAWERIGDRFTLKIVGDGPLNTLLEQRRPGVEWLRWQAREQVLELMREAAFLVLPSEWYENFPMTLVEAYASGLPVIASRLGSLAELVRDGHTGRHFQAGDAVDLADTLEWAIAHPGEVEGLGRAARQEFEARYTADRNYDELIGVYDRAREHARQSA
jgi:glycosyltransferase involved in cell wall biosynthesis